MPCRADDNGTLEVSLSQYWIFKMLACLIACLRCQLLQIVLGTAGGEGLRQWHLRASSISRNRAGLCLHLCDHALNCLRALNKMLEIG